MCFTFFLYFDQRENVAHDYASLYDKLAVPPEPPADEETFVDLHEMPHDEPQDMEIETPEVEPVTDLTEVQEEVHITEDVNVTLRKCQEALEKKDKEKYELIPTI